MRRSSSLLPMGVGLLALRVCLSIAHADSPLPLPSRHQVCSPAGSHCAVSDPDQKSTSVSARASDGKLAELWRLPGWYRQLAVSDQGALVTGYDGLDLVPREPSSDLVMLTFHVGGRTVRQVTLGELFVSLWFLRRTVSHQRWGGYRGWNAAGHYQVATTEGRVLAFDPATGERVDGWARSRPLVWVALAAAVGLLGTAFWRRTKGAPG